MQHFYRNIPKLGHVAVSRHAQNKMEKEGISEQMFQRVLYQGESIEEGPDVLWRQGLGIRIVILMNPTPNCGARLVKTVFKIKPQALAKAGK